MGVGGGDDWRVRAGRAPGDTHDTRYDAWENGNRAGPKLNRGERPLTGQSEESLRFHSTFRRQFRSSASKVPFSEVGSLRAREEP